MYDQAQLMRGTLEGCILKIIGLQTTYGYEIVLRLQEMGFAEVREGTIYPLLLRLEKKGMVDAEYRPSPLGPSRKYYTLTSGGRELLREFSESWREVSRVVDAILGMEGFGC